MSYKSAQNRTMKILSQGHGGDRVSMVCDLVIIGFVIANVIAVILESVSDLHEAFHAQFHVFEVFSIAFFTIEY
ncbi:MAG: ion transporter, partial [Paracoccaceae bacterium]